MDREDLRHHVYKVIDGMSEGELQGIMNAVERDRQRTGQAAEPLHRGGMEKSVYATTSEVSGSPTLGVTLDNIVECFTYQKPTTFKVEAMEQVREAAITLGKVILRVVPACPDRSTALRDLRSVRMWANSALSLHGRF